MATYLYIGAAAWKTKQRSTTSLQTTSLFSPTAKLLYKFHVPINKVEKTKRENFKFVIFFSSSSLLPRHNWKLYSVYEYYTYQTTALLHNICLFWLGTIYTVQLVSYSLKTVSNNASHSCSDTSYDSLQVHACIPGMLHVCISIVRPQLDYGMHGLQAAMSLSATNCE